MQSKTVSTLLANHTLANLHEITTKNNEVYRVEGHDIVFLISTEVVAIQSKPTQNTTLVYIDFDNIASLKFKIGSVPIDDTQGDIENVETNQRKRFAFVSQNDIGDDYIQDSIGQVKLTRVFAVDAELGDPVTQVQLKYHQANPNKLPTEVIKTSSVVIEEDLN